MKKVQTYIKIIFGWGLLLVLWWILTTETQFYIASIIGLLATGLIIILYCRFDLSIDIPPTTLLKPLLWIKFLSYLVFRISVSTALTCYLILTNNIKPKIVAFDTKLETKYGLLFLCNSITLTPTTIAIFEENKLIYIHHLYLEDQDDYEQMVDRICLYFETPLQKLIG